MHGLFRCGQAGVVAFFVMALSMALLSQPAGSAVICAEGSKTREQMAGKSVVRVHNLTKNFLYVSFYRGEIAGKYKARKQAKNKERAHYTFGLGSAAKTLTAIASIEYNSTPQAIVCTATVRNKKKSNVLGSDYESTWISGECDFSAAKEVCPTCYLSACKRSFDPGTTSRWITEFEISEK